MNGTGPIHADRLDAHVDDYASAGILACPAEAPVREVAWLMANNSVHAVLIATDRSLEPPVVSDANVVAAVASGHLDDLTAADIAVTEPVSIRSDETLARAARLLADHAVGHLIVRDERGTPVGVISTLDVARAACDQELGTGRGGSR